MDTIPEIGLVRLLVGFVPVVAAIALLIRFSLGAWHGLYATARMLIQLLVIGYVLTYIFEADQPYIVLLVLLVMMAVASWIALRPLAPRTPSRYAIAFAAVSASGLLTLALVTQGVLSLDPWYDPRYAVPLSGMIFSAGMNAVSLAAERYDAELSGGVLPADALPTALNAALIPQVNTLLAVGLVALPGMMTGQILAGVEPLIAVRYQIVVMCMLFGVTGMSAAAYLVLVQRLEIPVNQTRGRA